MCVCVCNALVCVCVCLGQCGCFIFVCVWMGVWVGLCVRAGSVWVCDMCDACMIHGTMLGIFYR